MDVRDRKAVAEFRAKLEGEDGRNEPETLTEARRAKVLKEGKLLDLKIAEQEKRLVSAREVQEAGVKIGVVVKQGMLRLENDLPPQLEGLPAARMKRVLRGVLRSMLQEWSEFTGEAIAQVGEGGR